MTEVILATDARRVDCRNSGDIPNDRSTGIDPKANERSYTSKERRQTKRIP